MSAPGPRGQLTFEFESTALPGLDDLEPGPNAEVFERIAQAAAGAPGSLAVQGPVGSGKTQLLLAACAGAERAGASVVYAPLVDLGVQVPAALANLGDQALVCLDDVDRAVLDPLARVALFNLWNAADARGATLLMSTREPLYALRTGLDDLDSRLRAALSLRLAPLDDDAMERAAALMARRRGIEVPVEVVRYLLVRLPRDLGTLADAIVGLDRLSLSRRRAVTVPLASEWLRSRSPALEAES